MRFNVEVTGNAVDLADHVLLFWEQQKAPAFGRLATTVKKTQNALQVTAELSSEHLEQACQSNGKLSFSVDVVHQYGFSRLGIKAQEAQLENAGIGPFQFYRTKYGNLSANNSVEL